VDAYDDYPYQSNAFPETHPNHLCVLGKLLGLETAAPSSARVLELGCASGGNLIPMAFHLPSARFLGVDLSASQIRAGQRVSRRLGLGNIELRQGDVRDLDSDLGEFDYIIAHGLYSWIPPTVREHLLSLAPRLLAPAGLFYVSYNTLPGWRMRGMLRDTLRYAARGAGTPEARIAAARSALDRLRGAIAGLDALSAQYLREEIAQLERAHPSYLLYEYLAEHNQAFLFTDFAEDAERAGLRYLCDTDLRTLFPSSYGAAVEEALAPIEDGVELEQWLDFVTNRNFRQSVLCRTDAPLPEDVAIDLDQFALLALRSDLKPVGRVQLEREQAQTFVSPGGTKLKISHPLTKAVVLLLASRYPDCLPLRQVVPAAVDRVTAAGGGIGDDVDACLAELFSLFAHAGVGARPTALSVRAAAGERPRISPLTLAQLEAGATQVTTIHHGNMDLDAFAARLIGYLDGSRTPAEAARALTEDLAAKRLQPPADVRPAQWPREKLAAKVQGAVEALIELFTRHGILTAAASGAGNDAA
jgi:SAM-dependent methyltransferase